MRTHAPLSSKVAPTLAPARVPAPKPAGARPGPDHSETERAGDGIGHDFARIRVLADGEGVIRRDNGHGPLPAAPLSAEEMFNIIVTERGFAFNRGGQVTEDPAGVGRGVGPAAGGRIARNSVFAVIQVTDAQGNVVVRSRGEYQQNLNRIFGTEHAESRGLRALEPSLQEAAGRLRGGRMLVVLDQEPCPPGRADCAGNLQATARRYGLDLDVRLPTRAAVNDPNAQVRPRTAAQGAQRTDLAANPATQVRLVRWYPGTPPAAPRGPGPGTPPPAPVPSAPPARPSGGGGQPDRAAGNTSGQRAIVGTPDMSPPVVGGPSARGTAIGAGITLAFMGANLFFNWLNDRVQAQRVEAALASISPAVAAQRQQSPDHGILLVFYYNQFQAPSESIIQPGPVFRTLDWATGRTLSEAQANYQSVSRIMAAPPRGSVERVSEMWIPPNQAAATNVLRTPFPSVAVGTFAGASAVFQDVEWGGVTGFDDEGTSTAAIPAGAVIEFLILRVPSRLRWSGAPSGPSSVPIVERNAASGGTVQVVDLDPDFPGFNVSAACVFPANDATARLFRGVRRTKDNLGQLDIHTNFNLVRWVRPENISILRRP